MPSELTPHQMKSVGENSVGPDAFANRDSINYNEAPNTFSESKILIPPHASAGTKSGPAAAKGKFVPYKGGKNISLNTNMKDSVSFDPSKDNGNPRHHSVASAGSHKHPMKKGGKRRRTMKKRKMARKHKKRSKSHHKRSRKMHKKRSRKMHKKHARKTHRNRKHKKPTRKHKRHSRRHRMRGGMPQPFSNVPISFGYSMNTTRLSPKMSALANPIPIKAYDTCGKVSRS